MATESDETTKSWETWYDSACLAYGLNDNTIQILEEEDCNTAEAFVALTEEDLKELPITVGQRRLVTNMLNDLKAWGHNVQLETEFRRAFRRGKYMIKAYYSDEEEEEEEEVLEAVTISATTNLQDEVLIYCKAYITFLKTGTLEDGDQLFTFVEDAVTRMNDGDYKGALLLLPEETSLPRSLAEKLQDGGYFILRHTDSFISDVRKMVKELWKGEEEEEEQEEEGWDSVKSDMSTLERNPSALLQTSYPNYTPSQLPGDDWLSLLESGGTAIQDSLLDEYWRGPDKIDPKTPVSSKTGKPGSSSKVNRKLFLGTPGPMRKDGLPDMRFKGNREMYPRNVDGSPDMRYKANKEVYGEGSTKSASSGHLKKDGTPDRRHKKNKASSGSATTAVHLKKDGTPDRRYKENKVSPKTGTTAQVSPAVHVKKDGTPDMRYKENKASKVSSGSATTADHLKKDGTPDRRYKENKTASSGGSVGYDSSSYLSYTAGPVKKDGTPANKVAYSLSAYPSGSSEGYGGSHSSSYSSGSYAAGPLKKDGTPDMRYAANKAAYGSSGSSYGGGSSYSSYGSSAYASGGSGGYGGSHSSSYSSGSYAAGPLKKDGTPDMRYAANKAAYGGGSYSSYGSSAYSSGGGSSYSRSSYSSGGGYAAGPLKRDGTPDMRYKANRR